MQATKAQRVSHGVVQGQAFLHVRFGREMLGGRAEKPEIRRRPRDVHHAGQAHGLAVVAAFG